MNDQSYYPSHASMVDNTRDGADLEIDSLREQLALTQAALKDANEELAAVRKEIAERRTAK